MSSIDQTVHATPNAEVIMRVEKSNTVVMTGLDVPFGNMVTFMVKWALASIPAAIMVATILGVCWLLLFAVCAAPFLGS